MRLYTYILTLCHDKGTVRIRTVAQNKASAIELVCKAENCPKRAIINIKRR